MDNTNNIPILAWNVQGAGSSNFLFTLKELIRIYSLKIMILVETKISGIAANEVCKKIAFDGVFCVEANGFKGGIWVLWREEELHLRVLSSSDQYATLEVSMRDAGGWLLSAIYGSPIEQKRTELWSELDGFARQNSHPWLLIGDFNDTRSMDERRNCSEHLSRRCSNFNNWIEINGFFDLGFSGPPYTWTRGTNPDTRKATTLDRGLCNQAWRLLFQEAGVLHLLQNQSDHCPLLLSPYGFTPQD